MRLSRTRLTLAYVNRSYHFGIAGILAIVSFMFLPLFILPIVRDVRLAVFGRTIQAKVAGKWQATLKEPRVLQAGLFAHGKRPSYQLRYVFDVNGRSYDGTASVTLAKWNGIQAGDPLEVVYLPSDPRVNRGGAPIWWTGATPFFLIGSAAFAASVRFILAGVRDLRQRTQLVAEGTPVLGLVNDVEIGRGRRGSSFIRRLAYQYATGQPGSEQLHKVDLTDSARISPFLPGEIHAGDVIVVIHDPSDPRRHEIDRFDARRDERLELLAAVERRVGG